MNPELLGNGLWLFLASQGSPEGKCPGVGSPWQDV